MYSRVVTLVELLLKGKLLIFLYLYFPINSLYNSFKAWIQLNNCCPFLFMANIYFYVFVMFRLEGIVGQLRKATELAWRTKSTIFHSIWCSRRNNTTKYYSYCIWRSSSNTMKLNSVVASFWIVIFVWNFLNACIRLVFCFICATLFMKNGMFFFVGFIQSMN